jgi:hypothetical protein
MPNDYEPLWVASQGAAMPQESIEEYRTRRHDADAKDRPEAEETGGADARTPRPHLLKEVRHAGVESSSR